MHPEHYNFIKKLKTDLALRPDNNSVGSTFGGNENQFLFLLTNTISAAEEDLYRVDRIYNGSLQITFPKTPNLTEAREALQKYFSTAADSFSFTKEELIDPTFIQSNFPRTTEIKLLVKSLLVAQDVNVELDRKLLFVKEIRNYFKPEINELKSQFVRDTGFSIDISEDQLEPLDEVQLAQHDMESRLFRKAFEQHPVWGVKLKEIEDRQGTMEKQLLSATDLEKLNFFNSVPGYIALYCVRSIIGITSIIGLELDSRCSFFTEITKEIQ